MKKKGRSSRGARSRREVAQPVEWVTEFRRLLSPIFFRVRSRLFVATNGEAAAKRFAAQWKRKAATIGDEAVFNCRQFCFEFERDETDYQRFHKNRQLGEAALLVWDVLLRQQYPRLRRTLFLINEYDLAVDECGHKAWERVVPTLMLWTSDVRDGNVLADAYHLAQLSPSKVLWRERLEEGLFELDEIFRIIGLPDNSREKRKLLRAHAGNLIAL